MKKTLIILITIFTCLPLVSVAQSYNILWKKYTEAERRDLPTDELIILEQIAGKAKAERKYGHLLKTELKIGQIKTSISPDSITPSLQRLKAKEAAAEHKDIILASIYQCALGKIYASLDLPDQDCKAESERWFKKAMSFPDKLANIKADTYVPLLLEGTDSHIFYNDLLHVIGYEAGDFKTMYKWYSEHNNRSAACLCALELIQLERKTDALEVKKSRYLQTIDSLINVYKDLAVAGELAIERYHFMDQATDATTADKYNYINYALSRWGGWPRMNILRNVQKRLTLPNFIVEIDKNILTPNTPKWVHIRQITNLQSITMSITRLNVNHALELTPNRAEDYAKISRLLLSNTTSTLTHRYVGQPPYKVCRDSMLIDGLSAGVYLIEFTTDNKEVKPERALLHVSDLTALTHALPKNQLRLIALNATSGQPVAGAHIRLSKQNWQTRKEQIIQTLITDRNGEAIYTGKEDVAFMIVSTEQDKFCPKIPTNNEMYFPEEADNTELNMQLFTDRSLYRPGQTVKVSVVAYTARHQNDETKVANGKTIKLTLRDANYKVQGEKTVTTDDYGTASAEFVLPRTGLTGYFSIAADKEANCSFRVEEYKRPTFDVAFSPYLNAYRSGDTIQVEGIAKSFAGIPVSGATVKLTIQRRPRFFWSNKFATDIYTFAPDTTITDAEGKFLARVPLFLPEAKKGESLYYNYVVQAVVTDIAGESHEASTTLPLSNRTTIFSTNLSGQLDKARLESFIFTYTNLLGKEQEAIVSYQIDGKTYTAAANQKIELNKFNLQSGRHELWATCGTDTLKQGFVVYSFKDKTAPIKTSDWFVISHDTFPADGSGVSVQYGSSEERVHVVYDIFSDQKLLEQGHIDLNKEVRTRTFKYKEEYGDGIVISMAWIKNGKHYTHQVNLEKPLPDKTLNMKWLTFRDRLTPGQNETWKLQITDKKGNAAKAQLMAVLYDKSLDDIMPHQWTFNLPLYRRLADISPWTGNNFYSINLYGEEPFHALQEMRLNFTKIDPSVLNWNDAYFNEQMMAYSVVASSPQKKRMFTGAIRTRALDIAKAKTINMDREDDANEEITEEPQKSRTSTLRKNFNETAFFYPALETDNQGHVSLRFTLPESVTTWKFMGFAHDKTMNYGFHKGEAVAQKTLMVMPNMPRFVRAGDHPQLSCRIANTTEKTQSGKLTMQLINPEDEKVVFAQSKNVTVKPKETIASAFAFNPQSIIGNEPTTILICRMMIEGYNFSDGEQHYLPILSDKEKVMNTVAFSQIQPGTQTIDVDQLFPVKESNNRLTIEYTNNPAWLMIKTLPSVAATETRNAISQAVAYYANSIAKDIITKSPKIAETIRLWNMEDKTDRKSAFETMSDELENTPWLQDAMREKEQQQLLMTYLDENTIDSRLAFNIKQLQKLQNTKGAFCWWENGPGNLYITLSVSIMLQRLNMMIGKQTATVQMLQKSMTYLEAEIAKEVSWLKTQRKTENKNLTPSESAIQYMYLCALRQENQNKADYQYLLKLLEEHPNYLTIYGKATMAVILGRAGKRWQAMQQLNSLKQYSVYKEEMGRYYDTRHAYYSWYDYKIPTQVAAIEALKLITPDDKTTITELQRWLLQSKRTQLWDTPINCANAVYAFVDGNLSTLTEPTTPATLKLGNTALTTTTAVPGTGYVQAQQTGSHFGTFTAENHANRITWGAVYAEFTQKATDIADATMGISVKREVITPNKDVKVGDKIKVRITITADRDYDFVQVSDHRAACMEPVRQLSGYTQGYYYSAKDETTYYYYDMMAKGTHVLETEYYIDRVGDYTTGTCTARCMYSPEYAGRAKGLKLQVK